MAKKDTQHTQYKEHEQYRQYDTYEDDFLEEESPSCDTLPKKTILLDTQQVAGYLSLGSNYSKTSDFEVRPGQIELCKNIAQCFNQNKIGVFEAGTGVGKSFAYLLPSILWALQNKERVVISTGTINLQQQLLQKDLPKAQQILQKKIAATLVKGRQQYLCKRRLQQATQDSLSLFVQEQEQLQGISLWAQNTKDGSISDIEKTPSSYVWSQVNSIADDCMSSKCPFFAECFVQAAKKKAFSSLILVVNHHVLFADIESRLEAGGVWNGTFVLPEYKRLIIDEAHSIESSATSFFSSTYSTLKLKKQLNLLYRPGAKLSGGGFIFVLLTLCRNTTATLQTFTKDIKAIKTLCTQLDTKALELLKDDYCKRLDAPPLNNTRLDNNGHNSNAFNDNALKASFIKLNKKICALTDKLQKLVSNIDEKYKDDENVFEAKVVLQRLKESASLCLDFGSLGKQEPSNTKQAQEAQENVFWLQKYSLPSGARQKQKAQNQEVAFYKTPLDSAPLIYKGVFEPFDTVICTSATLKIGDSFDFWLKKTGALFQIDKRLVTNTFASPFLYQKNMLFCVPTDSPLPSLPSFATYIQKTVLNLINASCGRALVLFTSYTALKATYEYVKNNTDPLIHIFFQGQQDRAKVLKSFKDDTNSVLFATDSFWQGVDVPGESLLQVIIVKLPFSVPNDPVWQARCESIEKSGQSSFFLLSVPDAVIKFRQGVGRLIRRIQDRGAVVVLDNRIITKQYGKVFLESLPECQKKFCSTKQIIQSVESFVN